MELPLNNFQNTFRLSDCTQNHDSPTTKVFVLEGNPEKMKIMPIFCFLSYIYPSLVMLLLLLLLLLLAILTTTITIITTHRRIYNSREMLLSNSVIISRIWT